MNLIGRIFTLLILLMSLCFLVIAVMVGASDRNWKKEAARENERASLAEKILEDTKSQKSNIENSLEVEKASRASQLSQLESQLKMARDDYTLKEKQLFAQVVIAQAQLAELEKAEKRLAQKDTELADLKSTNNHLVEDIKNQLGFVRNLQNAAHNLRNQIRQLNEQESDLVDKLAKVQKVMIMHDLDENSNTNAIVPRRESLVTKLGKDGLFAIRLGLDDGIRIGHEMDVFRQASGSTKARYVGKGVIVEVNDNMSVAREMPDLMSDSVRKGDYVTSKF